MVATLMAVHPALRPQRWVLYIHCLQGCAPDNPILKGTQYCVSIQGQVSKVFPELLKAIGHLKCGQYD